MQSSELYDSELFNQPIQQKIQKYTKQIRQFHPKRQHTTRIQRKPSQLIFDTSQIKIQSRKIAISCHCSECGPHTQLQKAIWRQYPLLETNHARRRRCLWRFKAVVNAVKFVMIYKTDTIRRVKKKIRMLSILRGGPLQRQRGTFINNQQHTPLMEMAKKERQISSGKQVQVDTYFSKLENDVIVPQQKTPKNSIPRKSPLQKYIDNLLKSTVIYQKKDYALQPLTKANKQYQKNLKTHSMWSLSGIKLSSIHSAYEKPITPFSNSSKPTNKTNKSNEYDQNNKEIFRMIGNMKCQRRMIRLRK